jgi:hypothetical protein
MRRSIAVIIFTVVAISTIIVPASAAAAPCEASPRTLCFGIATGTASLSTTAAGAHPDLTFTADLTRDPTAPLNPPGEYDAYARTRNIRFDLPPGLIGNPTILGAAQQCTMAQLAQGYKAECPNGSQIGLVTPTISLQGSAASFSEPLYMMQPPGGDVVARVGFIAVLYPIIIDIRVRSDGDYGLVSEVTEANPEAHLLKVETTLWGVPADPRHNTERCTPLEVYQHGCAESLSRPPGSLPLPFLTNPTRCGVPLEMRVSASSWAEPERFDTKSISFPEISECNRLPFGPSLEAEPTSHHTSSPSGLDLTIKLPASEGSEVLEPSQIRSLRIDLPPGLVIDTGSADGLATCSGEQVGFERNEASHCPDAAKLASTEFAVPVLERNLKGAIYLRESQPGDPFRIWIVADDLGLHLKLPGDLEVDKSTGQVHSIVLGAPQLKGLPQAPLREVKLQLKSGFRAPLITPDHCGTFYTHYEFVPWSGGPLAIGNTPMQITEGCATGGFDPKLQAGSTDVQGGAFAPFSFTITRHDGEQNISGLDVTLPTGLSASFKGVPRCEGANAASGNCPSDSQIGRVTAAVGAGPAPLWVPQSGKRPTAVYLGGPYKGAPISIVAVVPKQAGPFDFGDEVVRSAVFVNPLTAQATAKADPLPQLIEGIPVYYKTLNVALDRKDFTLNPTSCARKESVADLISAGGKTARPSSIYAAVNCAKLAFKPPLKLELRGSTKRAGNPALTAVVTPRQGDANLASTSVLLPHSEFIDQFHINNPCTRVQYNEGAGAGAGCPKGSIIGTVKAWTPLLDEPLSGYVYFRSNGGERKLPDIVMSLNGLFHIEQVGFVDSRHERIRTRFLSIPDAPLSKVVLKLFGGKRGLLENSANLCAHKQFAGIIIDGQNGRRTAENTIIDTSCRKKLKKHQRRSRPRPPSSPRP